MAATWKKLAYEDNVVLKSLYDANSMLMAVTDNTPEVLAIAANGIVGRLSTANIASLTPANVRTIINVADGAGPCNATTVDAAGAVMITDYSSANSIVAAETANAPTVLAVAANGIVGRLSTAAIAGLTPANVRTIINVEDGADVTDVTNVTNAGAVMEADYALKGDVAWASANGVVSMLGIGTLGQQITVGAADTVTWGAGGGGFLNTANATTRAALTPALGDTCFQVDTLEPYICTIIA